MARFLLGASAVLAMFAAIVFFIIGAWNMNDFGTSCAVTGIILLAYAALVGIFVTVIVDD